MYWMKKIKVIPFTNNITIILFAECNIIMQDMELYFINVFFRSVEAELDRFNITDAKSLSKKMEEGQKISINLTEVDDEKTTDSTVF